MQLKVYALRYNTLWKDLPDPIPHCTINPHVNMVGQAKLFVDYSFKNESMTPNRTSGPQ